MPDQSLIKPSKKRPAENKLTSCIPLESLLTGLVIALVVRTRHVFFRSPPGTLLMLSTSIFIGITLVIPYLPFNYLFGFIPLPAPLMLALIGLRLLYIVVRRQPRVISACKLLCDGQTPATPP